MKKTAAIILASVMLGSLWGCKDNAEKYDALYKSFQEYVSNRALEEDYYIQISKTDSSSNTITEAAKSGNDCAFMEFETASSSTSVSFYRNNALTTISSATYYNPVSTEASWSDFDYDSINERYMDVLHSLLDSEGERSIDKTKTDKSGYDYEITIRYNPSDLDTKTIFSNRGSYEIVTIKFCTDDKYSKFEDITVSSQYDYENTEYMYAVTFGEPNEPDEDEQNGQRPQDIKDAYDSYVESIEALTATED